MKLIAKFVVLGVLFSLGLIGGEGGFSSAARAAGTQGAHLKKIVAVSRFENRSSYAQGGQWFLTDGLADQLTDALMQSGAFIVMERQTLGDVMGEQDLAASGRVKKAQSARTGKITAAQILVKGAVTEFDMSAGKGGSGIRIGGFKLGSRKQTAHVGLIIRLIDSTTIEVLASQRVEGLAKAGGSAVGLNFRGVGFETDDFKRTPLGKATQIAIDKAVEFIAKEARKVPFQARVIKVTPNTVIISAGERNSITPGTTFTVMSVGEELSDPFTGELLGYEQNAIGQVKVSKVAEKYSFAKPVGTVKGIKIGDFVKLQ